MLINTEIPEIIGLHLHEDNIYVFGFQKSNLICARIDTKNKIHQSTQILANTWPKSITNTGNIIWSGKYLYIMTDGVVSQVNLYVFDLETAE